MKTPVDDSIAARLSTLRTWRVVSGDVMRRDRATTRCKE
jgi:hypothetical protein